MQPSSSLDTPVRSPSPDGAALTPRRTQLVRHSFARVQSGAPDAGRHFYARLFARDPALRPMFRGDIGQQGQRLMAMIGAAVALLHEPQRLHVALRELGERHVGYGVTDAHYDTVGAALIDTLAEGLGESFDAETRDAWLAVYGFVADTMRSARAAAPPVRT